VNGAPTILDVAGLGVSFGRDGPRVLEGVSLQLAAGKVLAIVGESGSGKTLLARSIIGLLPPGAAVRNGRIEFLGQDLAGLPSASMRKLRGDQVSMIFQEPQVSLNPVVRIGRQLTEAAIERRALTPEIARQRALDLLQRVKIPDPADVMKRYPHELSGGMCQRVMIAAALMLEPALLIADEPTTALDCAVQRDVLEVMLDAARQENTAVLLISHDLGLVAGYADDVLVLKAGSVVESRTARDILARPAAAYTRELLEAATVDRPASKRHIASEPACIVDGVTIDYPVRRDWPWQKQRFHRAVDNVSLTIHRGETVAVVGESGSGKTTLGMALLGLVETTSGAITVDGADVASDPGRTRRFTQLVFQNPYAALSPRKTVRESVAEPLLIDPTADKASIARRTRAMLDDVGLHASLDDRRPHQLSGGQRQRVSIARALITQPGLVIADEAVSALDVTIQAQILALFSRLQASHGFACLFVTHDLGVVEAIADRVVVLKRGRIVESGDTQAVFADPRHEYTRELLTAMPVLQRDAGTGFHIVNRHFNDVSS